MKIYVKMHASMKAENLHTFPFSGNVWWFCQYRRIQGYLFANDMQMCTGFCLGDVPIMQYKQYTTAKSPVKCNHQQFNYMYEPLPQSTTNLVPSVPLYPCILMQQKSVFASNLAS